MPLYLEESTLSLSLNKFETPYTNFTRKLDYPSYSKQHMSFNSQGIKWGMYIRFIDLDFRRKKPVSGTVGGTSISEDFLDKKSDAFRKEEIYRTSTACCLVDAALEASLDNVLEQQELEAGALSSVIMA